MSRASKTTQGHGKIETQLHSRRRELKEELDRIYYTLPFDEVSPIVSELKDTIDCLTEMGETHQPPSIQRHRTLRRRAA